MKAEAWQVPTLALLAALVAVFAALWLEGLSHPGPRGGMGTETPSARRRQLLWLAGWICAVVRLSIEVSGSSGPGWPLAVSVAADQLGPLMFLGSLAPQYLSRKPRILYVVAFGLPVMVYSSVAAVDPHPGLAAQAVVFACAVATFLVAARWCLHKHFIPVWLSLGIVAAVGLPCIWMTFHQEYAEVGALVHSGILLMTALLFVFAFRKPTAGLVLTVGGLAVWSLPAFVQPLFSGYILPLGFDRILHLVQVITAAGMIVLLLEEELASNQASQQRDRRARLEMEKYSALYLADFPVDEEGDEYDRVCATIAEISRFSQAALFVHSPDGSYRIGGRAGLSGALEGALDALARRTSEMRTLEVARGNYFVPVVGNLTRMDLTPLMEPGDELAQMNFRAAWVMGMRTRDGRLQGALLLAGLRHPQEPILAEDVMPLELLVSRIGAAREHVALLRRLMQSERLAGLGQLAGGVAHELNNPLQSVTGFAELMAEGDNAHAQSHARVILAEARRMKLIVESLMRFRNAASTNRAPIALDVLLRDIARLMRHDLEGARIVLDVRIPENLPKVKADGEQIRQVFLQVIRNAIASIEEAPLEADRRLAIEVAAIPKAVEIMFSDTGPGFPEPARAFDPYFTKRHAGEGVGLGLSICYAVVREHGGAISAVNLDPRGAAVVIELPTSVEDAPARVEPDVPNSPAAP